MERDQEELLIMDRKRGKMYVFVDYNKIVL